VRPAPAGLPFKPAKGPATLRTLTASAGRAALPAPRLRGARRDGLGHEASLRVPQCGRYELP